MLQSFFSDKLSQFNPGLPGLIAVAVVVAFYCTNGTAESTVEAEDEQDGKVVSKHIRYLPSKIPVLGNAIELLANSERMYDWITDQMVPFDGEPFRLSLPGKEDMMFIACHGFNHNMAIIVQQAVLFQPSPHGSNSKTPQVSAAPG